jgi:hypothetical protein
MLFMGLPVSGAEVLYVFVVLLMIIYLIAYYFQFDNNRIWIFPLAIMLLFFSVTHYHPQWFLWLSPLLLIELVSNGFKHRILVVGLFFCWLGIMLFFEPSLSYGAFSAIIPQLSITPGFSEIFKKYLDVYQIKSILRSIFAAFSIFYLYLLIFSTRIKKAL